jgi:hypothetical protein
MKQLLTGVAVVAALAFSAPAWAQPANPYPTPYNPSGGNALGMPGPNPGGGGLTPYTTGQPQPRAMPAPPPSAPPAAMAPSTAVPPPESTSATPPSYRHAHHKTAGHYRGGKGPQLTGNTADQLNQEELARLQGGSMPMPAAAPGPGMAPPPPAPYYPGSPGPKASGHGGSP